MDFGVNVASLLFCAKTGACAGLFVVLDFLIVQARPGQESFLRISHGIKATPIHFAVWMLGAGLVAWIGTLINFYQETTQSVVLIALTWHTFFTQLSTWKNAVSNPTEEVQRPEGR